jgi:hypothetical protein
MPIHIQTLANTCLISNPAAGVFALLAVIFGSNNLQLTQVEDKPTTTQIVLEKETQLCDIVLAERTV